jgi:hypothetical protein
VIDLLERGGVLRCGAYLLLSDDGERLESEPYRAASERAIGHLAV